MMHHTYHYTSDLNELAGMRLFLRRAWEQGDRLTWSAGSEPHGQELRDLELALHEAAANVIRHAYAGESGHPLWLELHFLPDRVVACLYHYGGEFDPSGVPQPRFDGSQTGGFGLYLIDQLVDNCVYLCQEGGLHGVRLVKKLQPAPASAVGV